MNCRHCKTPLEHVFLDLGFAPPSNAYLATQDIHKPEKYFPLKLFVCDKCWLVQTEDYNDASELFSSDYAYFSSISSGWLNHAYEYSQMITDRLALDSNSLVIEIAANDGYLLKNFVNTNIPCLGIEPTDSTADAAESLNIPVIREFFGASLAKKLVKEKKQADLIAGNNVYAHVPDINDFTQGLKTALKPNGTITLEFPHLLCLIESSQFDTVYHEHYSYLSLFSVCRIFEAHGLRIYDVEQLPTHGGSLRIYGCHIDDKRDTNSSVDNIISIENNNGLRDLSLYKNFQDKACNVKNDFVQFLIQAYNNKQSVVAYGAAAKGNTLINFGGIKTDLLPFIFDAAPSKQNKYSPGSHIPILAPDKLKDMKPDYVVILPWNIASEVIEQNSFIREWGGKFVTAVPKLKII
ncbi:MAG: class I SAM-dependent methyltransferase [Gammaproteobacteria bacterium]|nr:class I SAM-dependent methyltransferase [Gammaproteobacteria bacterium]